MPENPNAPPLIEGDQSVWLSHFGHVATTEHGRNLADILFARTGIGYRHQLRDEEIQRAAQAVSIHLGWDAAEVDRQAAATRSRIDTLYRTTPAAN